MSCCGRCCWFCTGDAGRDERGRPVAQGAGCELIAYVIDSSADPKGNLVPSLVEPLTECLCEMSSDAEFSFTLRSALRPLIALHYFRRHRAARSPINCVQPERQNCCPEEVAMYYFREFGDQLDARWRRSRYDERELPAIAVDLMRSEGILDRIDVQDVLQNAAEGGRLDWLQNESRFGDLSYIVFRNRRFYLEVLVWTDRRHDNPRPCLLGRLRGHSGRQPVRDLRLRAACAHQLEIQDRQPRRQTVRAPEPERHTADPRGARPHPRPVPLG